MKLRRFVPLPALTLATLAACATPAADQSASPPQAEAGAAAAASPEESRLSSAEAAADGGDYGLCAKLINPLTGAALDPDQELRWRILRARIALAGGNPRMALDLLPPNPAPTPAAGRALLWRARVLFQLQDTVGATAALVQRERSLAEPAAIADNHKELWTDLSTAQLDSTVLQRAGSADPVTRGWIELANLARRKAPPEFYDNWRRRYPDHPAQDQLAALLAPAPAAQPAAAAPEPGAPLPQATAPAARPGFFALLLPQSGGLAVPAEAVRQGFSDALAGAGGGGPGVRVYDTSGATTQVLDAYGHAISDGAGLVIGPLLRDSVAALAQAGALSVPVLALNYLDYGRSVPPGLYQFGLAPEDEARAAAEDASGRGLHRALVMVGDNERGERVRAAFTDRLLQLGGTVVDSGHYSGEPKDWSDPVAALLHFRAVEDKKKASELRARSRPGVDPQRRNDFDFIFIDAKASQARQLWPLFRYYHAERMPIYDTAAVDEGNGDQDLSGIRFCDAPWLLDASPVGISQRGSATANGRSRELARLYELGSDAYALAQRLGQGTDSGGLHPLDELPGATGTLRVGDDGSVHRGLVCAQITEGEPRPLEAPAPLGASEAP